MPFVYVFSAQLPLEGALHLLLFLMSFLDLVGDPGQKFLKIGQEVRLITSELDPKAAHLVWTGEREEKGIKRERQNST